MQVQANADTPDEAAARQAGASGIGLCRTERLLLQASRVSLMCALVTATDDAARECALRELLPQHRADLRAVLEAAAPLPLTVRLLDPPLKDFLPTLEELAASISEAHGEENWDRLFDLNNLRSRYKLHSAVNPSMGHRACRLSLTHPEILTMQITAILEAARAVSPDGRPAVVNILLPLVASEEETAFLTKIIRQTAARVLGAEAGKCCRIGALIETPRAALCAGPISDHVDFLSFGTNDLTQLTYGSSKEDTPSYLLSYLQQGIFAQDPFVSLDRSGVGQLMSMAIQAARQRHPDLEISVCGDHTQDTDSVRFFSEIGASSISCPAAYVASAKELLS